jgi:serine/threonine protein kinase
MTEPYATKEYEEIISIKSKLDTIKDYQDYFLIDNFKICKPDKLTKSDLTDFTNKCKVMHKKNINKKNINENLNKLMIINMPYGGIPIDDYLYDNGSFKTIYLVHKSLFKLLKKGIVEMNKKNIFHADIKDSNILIDDKLNSRLIDWGLCVQYTPFFNNPFPKTWRNRPLQFNVPFSVIIFSDDFVEKYTHFIKDGGKIQETELKPFIIDYINFWMKKRGGGHYKFINEIMYILFSKTFPSVSKNDMPKIIETQITMPYIVNYILDVLIHFTKFRKDGSLNLREYFDNVFIKIVDIWGLINVYYPILEIFSNNSESLTEKELNIFNKLKYIFLEYLYNPRHEAININILYVDFQELSNLIQLKILNKKHDYNTLTITNSKIGGLKYKTKKLRKTNNSIKNTLFTFKRRPKLKRFKNPIFLTFKK